MRGKKAKALRKMVGYVPTEHRPELPGDALPTGTTVMLPKDHPRRAYEFAKARYGMLPLAQMLTRLRRGFGDDKA